MSLRKSRTIMDSYYILRLKDFKMLQKRGKGLKTKDNSAKF